MSNEEQGRSIIDDLAVQVRVLTYEELTAIASMVECELIERMAQDQPNMEA